MEKIKHYIKSNWLTLIGIFVGAIAGYLYWYNVGCATGTCLIKSSPYLMIIYGSLIGSVLFSLFQKVGDKKKNN